MGNDPDNEINELWLKYFETKDVVNRNQLIVNYAPLVKYVANRLGAGLPNNVEQADLVNYGFFGLMDAIDRFDIGRGNKFETYAMRRIKGAILDGLRSYDRVPRTIRAKAKAIEKAIAKLEAQLGRTPSEAELAKKLEMTVAQLQATLTQIAAAGVIALDEVLGSGPDRGEITTLGETLASPGEGPAAQVERQEMRRLLAEAINGMADRDKIVLMLYYYEHFTLAEIGRLLNVTESRVCQIHTKAVMQLKSVLGRMLGDPPDR